MAATATASPKISDQAEKLLLDETTDVGPIVAEPDWTVSFDGSAWSDDLPDSATVGEYIVQLTNDGDGEALVAFGWLTGDATLEDQEAWEGIDQPSPRGFPIPIRCRRCSGSM